ncbi:DUF2799 domain-containing protein [Veronia nyctiphanis]|nr:DUF2799 domain-containing protein [Veronia nyctiphanis]
MKKIALPCAPILILLSACAFSPVDKAIEQGDWYRLGQIDGERGERAKSHKDLSVLAKKAGVSADLSLYDEGYLAGNGMYCNVQSAYHIGLSGSIYRGVCESRPESLNFRLEWQRGYDQYKNSEGINRGF